MARCRATDARLRRTPAGVAETPARRRQPGFTLTEVLISVVIIAIVLSISGLAVRGLTDSSVMAQARAAVLTHAQIARSYAVANHIETMLVVNPHNGRFEIWHLNPPAQGGEWDPLSETSPDGYAFAPVLDASARLPIDGDGRPAARVHPIDYDDPLYRPTSGPLPTERYMDNLTWAAFCFDENGDLVIRTRRIATQLYYLGDGSQNPIAHRLIDASPDLTAPALVDANDSPITSTRGFVISDASKMRVALGGAAVTPLELVFTWLMETRPGRRYAHAAKTVVLNRFSGDELGGDS